MELKHDDELVTERGNVSFAESQPRNQQIEVRHVYWVEVPAGAGVWPLQDQGGGGACLIV